MLIAAPVDDAVYRKTTLPIIAAKKHCTADQALWRTAKASISSAMSQWREIRRTHSPLSAGSWIYAASIQCPAGRCRLATVDGGKAVWHCLRPPSSSPSGHLPEAHSAILWRERQRERGGSVKARCQGEVIGRRGFSWLYCRMQR